VSFHRRSRGGAWCNGCPTKRDLPAATRCARRILREWHKTIAHRAALRNREAGARRCRRCGGGPNKAAGGQFRDGCRPADDKRRASFADRRSGPPLAAHIRRCCKCHRASAGSPRCVASARPAAIHKHDTCCRNRCCHLMQEPRARRACWPSEDARDTTCRCARWLRPRPSCRSATHFQLRSRPRRFPDAPPRSGGRFPE
jgi:hypothetical protein